MDKTPESSEKVFAAILTEIESKIDTGNGFCIFGIAKQIRAYGDIRVQEACEKGEGK